MTRRSIEAILIVAGIFGAGVVAGGAADRLWLRPASAAVEGARCGGRSPDELVALFRTRLELDRDQLAAIEPILRRGWAEIAAVYEGAEPAIGVVRDRTRGLIRGLLRPAQDALYDALAAELDARRADKRRCRQDGIAAARALPDGAPR
jgi:hypothetical protein